MKTNKKFCNEISPDFNSWLTNDINENDLLRVSKILFKFFEEYVFADKLVAKELSERLENGFKANLIGYDVIEDIYSYAILHFLDRYHRHQKIYLNFFKDGIFPLRENRTIDVLDIGAGPSPSLFALADLFKNLKEFGNLNGIKRLKNLEYQFDYAERSYEFRSFLHDFTELANRYGTGVGVPFHHGNIGDVKGLNLQKLKLELQQSLIDKAMDEDPDLTRAEAQWYVDYEQGGWKDEYRYNIVTLSYFLNYIDDVKNFNDELNSVCESLRNGGLIIFVGYPGIKNKETYHEITKIMYQNKLKKIHQDLFRDENIRYENKFGEIIKEFDHRILNKFRLMKLDNNIPPSVIPYLENPRINPTVGTMIFRKGP